MQKLVESLESNFFHLKLLFSRKSNLEAFQVRANLVDFRLDKDSICKNIISIRHTKTKEKFRIKFYLESHFPESQNWEFMKSMRIELILY